ncbi:MAG: hypothetical protein ACXIT9_13955, partial [Nitritalea sp.]
MKLINNQDTLLLDELKKVISNQSEIYISSGYLTLPAIFELWEELSQVNSVKVLIDGSVESDLRFVYDESEYQNYFSLNSSYKSKKVIKLIEEKFQVRTGHAGGQRFILVINPDQSHCFFIVSQNLNL